MKIVALETIKYKKTNRVPNTDSAVFDCTKEVAEQLIKDGKACLPQTLEQASQSSGEKKAADLIAEAEKQAEQIVKEAEKKAEEIVKEAEEQADAIRQDAEGTE